MRTRYDWDQEGGLDPDPGPVPPDQDGLLLISSSWPGVNGSSRKNWENQMDGWRIYLFFLLGLIKLNLDELLSFFLLVCGWVTSPFPLVSIVLVSLIRIQIQSKV